MINTVRNIALNALVYFFIDRKIYVMLTLQEIMLKAKFSSSKKIILLSQITIKESPDVSSILFLSENIFLWDLQNCQALVKGLAPVLMQKPYTLHLLEVEVASGYYTKPCVF